MPDELQEFSYELRVPKERIAVVIGTAGETKRRLEGLTKTKIEVNSQEGLVTLSGNDALGLYTVREIIRAIARGFSPETAEFLLKQDYGLEIVNLAQYAKTSNDLVRLRGRVIGEEGKSRRVIEELTDAHISVFGKTVALIGSFESLTLARKAVEMLIDGAAHATVFRYLEKHRRVLKAM
jgi:ribosomal RNA assembly protein